FYRTVLEGLAEGVIISDTDDRIFYANGVVSEITGYQPEELLGAKMRDLLLIDTPAVPADARASHGCPIHHEVELKRKDGRLGWINVRSTPYRDQAGEAAGTIT